MDDKAVDLYALDPDFFRGTGAFVFENGDKYEGAYCAHRTGIVWREGIGTYKTSEGQSYTGVWMDDKLVEKTETAVSYPNGVNFFGQIVKNKYEGNGMYVLENHMSVLCQFQGNKPIGEITLIDAKGKEWNGNADEFEALLLPEHLYFTNIHDDLGKGRSRKEPTITTVVENVVSQTIKKIEEPKCLEYMNALALKIFAKTKRTVSDLKFEDSDWYKNFITFKKVFENINKKIQDSGVDALDEIEKQWHKKYKEFKKKYSDILDAKKRNKRKLSEYKLFELYNSEEFKNSCPPISVFYPSPAPECSDTECN